MKVADYIINFLGEKGIKDVFKNVNSYNGFWAIRKSKKGWKDIDFTKFK
jgi:hypothetical protein